MGERWYGLLREERSGLADYLFIETCHFFRFQGPAVVIEGNVDDAIWGQADNPIVFCQVADLEFRQHAVAVPTGYELRVLLDRREKKGRLTVETPAKQLPEDPAVELILPAETGPGGRDARLFIETIDKPACNKRFRGAETVAHGTEIAGPAPL